MAAEKLRCGKCGRLLRYEAKTVKEYRVPCEECGAQTPVEAKAIARFVRTAPRKLRLIADAIRGKSVAEALTLLRFTGKRAARVVSDVVKSARANAESAYQMNPDELYISTVMVDGGPTLFRFMPRAMGRAATIRKRTSHVTVKVRQGMPAVVIPRKAAQEPSIKKTRKATPKPEGSRPKQQPPQAKTREKKSPETPPAKTKSKKKNQSEA